MCIYIYLCYLDETYFAVPHFDSECVSYAVKPILVLSKCFRVDREEYKQSSKLKWETK